MSITLLPSGRLRAQVYDPASGKNVNVAEVLGLPRAQKPGNASLAADLGLPPRKTTWPNTRQGRRHAQKARELARERLGGVRSDVPTVARWRERVLNDPLFARPKEATMVHLGERTKSFADRYGDLPIDQVGDFIVAQWLEGGERNSTVPALRAIFGDATKAKAGRILPFNPWAGLGIEKTKGSKDRQPPSREQMEMMVRLAWEVTPPSFAGYLEFACCTAIRPGELDALRLDKIDDAAGGGPVVTQWNAKLGKETLPKYGPYTVALPARAREALVKTPRDKGAGEFAFTTLRGHHYTPSSRTHHWNRVRAAAGLAAMRFYVATRHFFGWYGLNVLGIPPHVLAEQFGHKDGGKLILELYGHPDKALMRQQIRDAHDGAARVRPLRVVRKDVAS